MLLSFSSNFVIRKRISHQKCIHFIALIIILTFYNHAAAQEKFQICGRLSQAICQQWNLFAQKNKIQPPLKYSSNFPPSNSPSCPTIQVISDWDPEKQVCMKSFMCTASGPNEPRSTHFDPDPNQKYKEPCDPPLLGVKIVGGIEACPHEFPYQVRLYSLYDRLNFCGGSLLSPNYVLTAAHCVLNVSLYSIQVILGDHDRLAEEGTEQTVNADAITTHKDYARTHGKHDIALIKVAPPLQLNQNVQPILLPRATYDPLKGNAVASGWGRLEYSNPQHPRKLRKVTVPILTFEECNKLYDIPGFPRNVTETQLCTGDAAKGGIAPCTADSGGPLAQKLPNGSFVQIGIPSWAFGCGDPSYPNVYTKVSKYLDWIRQHMK